MLGVGKSWGQTNPTAQSLPYTQNFGTTTFTAMPTGMAAWNTFGSNLTTQALAEASIAGANATVAVQIASTTTGGVYGYAASSNARAYIQQSSNATNGTNQIVLAIATGSNTAINVSYDLELINGGLATQDYGHELQYRSGTTGTWTNVTGSAMTFGAVTTYTTTTKSFTISGLSASTNYQIRWIVWRPSGTGASKGIGIDNISVVGVSPTISNTGTLSAVNTTYGTASATPTSFSVSGANMSAGILVTPPAGYEVCLTSGGTYTATVTVGSSGTISSTTVYVRLKANATVAGSPYSGNIVLSSSGATSVNVATVSSTVSALSVSTTGATAQDKPFDGTTAAVITGASVVGTVNSDVITVTGGGTFASSAVGTGISVTANLTLSGTNSSSYSLTQPTGLTANILLASCNAPSSPIGTATASNSANLSWTAASSSPSNGYDYEVRSSGVGGSGFTGLDVVGNISTTSTSVSTLNANTTYTLYVRANCGSNQSAWIASSTFTTPAILPVISLSNGTISTTTFIQNSTNNILYRADVTVSTISTVLNSVSFNLSGTYTSSDLVNLKLWYQSSSTFNSGSAILLSTLTTSLGAGIQTFGSLTRTFPIGTNYLFVTADLNCTSTPNATISVGAPLSSDFTFSSGTPSGTLSATSSQTINAVTINNASSITTTPLFASATISWTNPTGCFDDVMIVVAPSTSNTGTPSGNSYTGNLAYASGSALGNGYVVYKGTTSPQTITNLTNGVTYYVKIFTRNGTSWNSGTEVTVLPTNGFIPFSAGSLVVLRADGNGAALTTNGTKVFLDEYTNTGSNILSNRSMPTLVNGNNLRLVVSGSSTSDGHLTLSPDTKYLVCGGYDAAVNTTGVSSSTSGAGGTARVVGILNNAGEINTSTSFLGTSTPYSGNNFRGGVTDGINIWGVGAGTGGGVRIIPFPSGTFGLPSTSNQGNGTQISTTSTNGRVLGIFNNQLYLNSSSGVFAPSAVGTGLPTTSGQTIVTPTGLPTAGTNGYDFVFFDRDQTVAGNDLLYVADLNSTTTGSSGGINKYSYNGTTWTSRGSVIALGTAPAGGIGSLIGKINCNDQIELYCVWGNGSSANKIYKFVDAAAYNSNITSNGSDISSVGTLLATAATNNTFKGLSWAPTQGNLIVSSGTSNASGAYSNITVSGGTLTLTGDIYADNITIQNGGTIDCSTFKILSNGIGKSTFDLQNGATLKTANVAGITSSSATGSVQTCIRNYSSSANYIYNGTLAQLTGDGLPSNVSSFTINNNAGVTLSSSLTTPTLNLTLGALSTSSNNITISNGGVVNGGSNSSYVNGNLVKSINSGSNVNVTFEVGSNSKYSSITLSFPSVTASGSAKVSSISGDNSSINTSCITASKSVNRFWSISFPTAPSPAIYDASVNYQSSDIDAGITNANVIAGMYNASWSYALATNNFTTSSVSIIGINSTSTFDLQLGEGNASAPNVTSPATYCQYNTISALTATGTNKLWYTAINSTSSSSAAPIPSTAVSGLPLGSYYVTQTVSGCTSNRSEIIVNINASPNPPSVTNINYCQNATTAQLTAIGTSLKWYTSATGGTGVSTAPTPSSSTPSITSYYVTQDNGTCESQRAQLDVTVISAPIAPIVSSPVGLCQGATSSALSATGVNLKWYTTSTTGVGGSTTAPTPSTATLGAPVVSYWVTQTIGGCPEGPSSQIDVNVYAIPAAPNVTSPISYCQNAPVIALAATGTNLVWYNSSTGGTGSATAPTPSTSSVGTPSVSYYVATTQNGCESPRSQINVNVNSLPTVPTATTPINLCQNAVASSLTAVGTNLLWYNSSTGGTGSSTAPTPLTNSIGAPTIAYWVSQTDVNSCESNRKQIDVNVYSIPAAPAVISPLNLCQNTVASALTATGSNLVWYSSSTGGTGTTTAPTPSTVAIGSPIASYWVSQTINFCESPYSQIDINVNAIPVAPSVTTPVVYTQGSTASALTATGSNLLWYTTSTGGTSNAIAPTPSTLATGNPASQYWVSQTLNACESPRSLINIRVTGLPYIPGNLAVLRLGTGAAIGSAASQVTIDEYSTAGSLVLSRPLPNTVNGTNYPLTNSGSAGSEGALSLSGDHQYLSMAGYNATVGTTSVASTTVGRVIGIMDSYGETNTSTILPTVFSGNNIRGAITSNGTDIWASSPLGVVSTTLGANSNGTSLYSSSTNTRTLGIYNNQLYSSFSSAINKVGTGLPTTTSQTNSSLLSYAGTNAYAFIMFDIDPLVTGNDLIYIADQTAGIYKYSFNGTTWTARGNIPATGGCTGLTAFETCSGIEIYVTVGTTAGNKIYKFIDATAYNATITNSGTNISTSGVLIATAPTNTIFRGLALTPFTDLVINSNQTLAAGNYGNITVNGGATLSLSGNIKLFGNLTVNSNAVLDCGNYTVSSAGNFKSKFDMQNGATIKIGHAQGISQLPNTGAIQTCFRNFSTLGNYIYNGSSAQNTGDALPSTINSIQVNNSQGLTLTNTVQVSGFITLISGKINTLNNYIGTSGNISGNNSSNYINGSLRRTIQSGTLVNIDFPIGDAINYSPLKIKANSVTTAGDILVSSVNSDYSNLNTSCLNPTLSINRYWTLKPLSLISPINFSAVVNYINTDFDLGLTNVSNLTGEYYSGNNSTWNLAQISNTSNSSSTFNNLSFADTLILQLGNQSCKPVTNDDPCNSLNASANTGQIAGLPTVFSAFDNGLGVFSGIDNNPNATNPVSAAPYGPNLVYYSGNTLLSSSLGSNEPTPSCGNIGSNPKTIWYKFKVPTLSPMTIFIRSTYPSTSFKTNLTAYTISTNNPCSANTFTEIACASGQSTSNNALLVLNSSTLSSLGGQYIYIQVSGVNGAAGNFLISLQAVTSGFSLTNPTTTSLQVNLPTVLNASRLAIYWQKSGSSGVSFVFIPTTQSNYLIKGLNSGSNYRVWTRYLDNSGSNIFTTNSTLGTTAGCGGNLQAPTVVGIAGHCSQANITWPSPAAQGIPGQLISPPSTYPYRLTWGFTNSTGYHGIIQTLSAIPINGFNAVNLPINGSVNFWYSYKCVGGALMTSNITNYMTCNGAARTSKTNETEYVINGVHYLNASEEELINALTAEIADDGQMHEFNLVNIANENSSFNSKLESEDNVDITLNPNPANSAVSISYPTSLNSSDKIEIVITDINGSLIKSIEVIPQSINKYSLDISELNQGVYLISLKSGNFNATKKLVKIN